MEKEKLKVKQIIANGYRLNIGDILNKSFDLFQKGFKFGVLIAMIYGVTYYIITTVIGEITGTGVLLNDFTQELNNEILQGGANFEVYAERITQFMNENIKQIVIYNVLIKLIMVLSFPLAGGMMLVYKDLEEKGESSFSRLFEAFKPKYWGRLVGLAFVATFVFFIGYVIYFSSGSSLSFLPSVYVWLTFVLACPMIMFTQANVFEAIGTSIQIVNRNWLKFFALLLIVTFISYIGIVICGMGIVFTYPFWFSTIYILYKEIIDANQEVKDEENI